MQEITAQTAVFSASGPDCTRRTLELARQRAEELGIRTVLAATTSGATGALAAKVFQGWDLIVVSHSTGFKHANEQEMTPENRSIIEKSGARILTCQHAFGGVNRAVRKMLNTYELDEIIANVLRIFGDGMKVNCEMALMAADAGLVRTDQPVLCIAGTGSGADTAVILQPANAQAFFKLRVLEIICRPAPEHPLVMK